MRKHKRLQSNSIITKKFTYIFILALAAGLFSALQFWPAGQTADMYKSSARLLAHGDIEDDHPYSQDKTSTISFPVSELGNCVNKDACKTFCGRDENMLACVNFADKHGLISKDVARKGRKMAELGTAKGPGGCESAKTCETYCANVKNIRECVAFGKKTGMMSSVELKEAEKVITALDKGAKLPGGCTSKASCDAYCQKPENIRQCIAFAEAAGFVTAKEAAMMRKTRGVGPGGCFGKDACEKYCMAANNMEQCINFAVEHDLMPVGELAEAKKVLAALKKGVKMPNCRNKADCDVYCRKPANTKECLDFAEAAGFIDPNEAKFVRKMMEKGITSGPGGCTSNESCEAYCKQPLHMPQCLAFMKKVGISPEDLPRGKDFKRDFDSGFEPSEEFEDEDFDEEEFAPREDLEDFEGADIDDF